MERFDPNHQRSPKNNRKKNGAKAYASFNGSAQRKGVQGGIGGTTKMTSSAAHQLRGKGENRGASRLIQILNFSSKVSAFRIFSQTNNRVILFACPILN